MNPSQDQRVTRFVAELSAAGVSLEQGLLAAAEESPGSRTARGLRQLAGELSAGKTLQDALAQNGDSLTCFVRAAVKAGLASREFANVLVELTTFENERRELRQRLKRNLTYPILLFVMSAATLLFALGYLYPAIQTASSEFPEDSFQSLGYTATIIGWLTRVGLRYCLLAGGGLLAAALLARWLAGPARWSWFLVALPIVGPIVQWSALWEFTTHLRVLLTRDVQLPAALRIAGQASSNHNLADLAQRLAAGVAMGQTMSQQLQGTARVPKTFTAVVRWGEEQDCLPSALEIATAIFRERLRLRVGLLSSVLPSLTYIAVAMVAVTVGCGVILPLVNLIQSLSSFGVMNAPRYAPMLGANWIGLIMLGGGLWWTVHLLFLERGANDAFLPFALRVAGLIMIFFGLASLTVSIGIFLALPILVVVVIVFLMVANRYRTSETRALLWQLGLAMEQGMPLISAARSFGEERSDDIGLRAFQLVARMERGVPFREALRQARLPLTTESELVARLGLQGSDLASTLTDSVNEGYQKIDGSTGLLQRWIYLLMLPTAATFIWCFICLRIMPTFSQIFDDFEMELPGPTQMAISISEAMLGGGPYGRLVWALTVATLSGLLLIAVVAIFYYIGWLRWEPPVVRRLTARYHGALILKNLAGRIQLGQELIASLTAIATSYPVRYVQLRLVTVIESAQAGQDWIDLLAQQGLVSRSTAGVLRSARRAGNLSWAMTEMADSAIRGLMLRTTAITQLTTPIMLVLFALPIGFMSVAVYLPLSQLIRALC